MRRAAALLLPGLIACDPGPAPATGTWAVSMSGTLSYTDDEGIPPQEIPAILDSTAVVYVDVGALGTSMDQVFYQQGIYPPPNQGRLFELRLFPMAFEEENDAITFAGVFEGEEVAAIGQTLYSYVADVTLPGDVEPTRCYPFERYRGAYLSGTWTDEIWTVTMEVLYQDFCFSASGEQLTDGYPEWHYTLTGTLTPLYALPVEEEEGAEKEVRP